MQYCNHIKTNQLWQKVAGDAPGRNGSIPSVVVVYGYKCKRAAHKGTALYFLTLKSKSNGEAKFHELNPGQKTDQVSV